MKRIAICLLFLLAPLAAVAQAGIHTVTVSWTQSTGCTAPPPCPITGNILSRGTVNGGPYTVVINSSTPITTFNDTGLTAGVYFYVIQAVSGTIPSSFSAPITATVFDVNTVTVPTAKQTQ